MSVKTLATKEEFDACLSAAGQGLVVVDFTATWCGPCKRIAPFYASLAEEFKHVVFAKVDVDENQETAAACGVKSMPTFHFYKESAVVHVVSGADEKGLREGVNQHAGDKWSTMTGGNTLSSSSSSAAPAGDARAAAAAAAAARFATAPPPEIAPTAPASSAPSAAGTGVKFEVDATAAVASSKTAGKPMVVFVHGDFDDEAVDRLETSLWGDASVKASAAAGSFIPLQLSQDSEGGKQFSQIYPVTGTPCVHVVTSDGRLVQSITGESSLTPPALHAALMAASAPAEAALGAMAAILATAASAAPLTQANPHTASPMGVYSEREKVLNQQKQLKEQEEKRKDAEAKETVRRQLAADRAERLAKNAKTTPAPAPTVAESAAANVGARSSQAMLQIRLFNGDTIRHTFASESSLESVFAHVRDNRTDGDRPFVLMQTYPKRMLSLEDNGEQTLAELDLCPSASLLLTAVPGEGQGGPAGDGQAQGKGGWFSWAASGVASVIGSTPAAQEGGAATAPAPRRGGMATLSDLRADAKEEREKDPKKKEDFNNGNSTAFQG